MLKIKEIPVAGYQKVIEAIDDEVGLHAFIAIHNCTLGPAMGGTRIYPYKDKQDALNDVLLLAKSMTYKSAIAEDGLGGGKSVIIADPATEKTEALLWAFGDAIQSLEGSYIAAEDVGTSTDDMMIIRQRTPYVAALPTEHSSGDPSRYTAHGVFIGMRAVAKKLWGNDSLKGKRVAIQGLGHVGSKLASLLFWEGAELIFTDVDHELLHRLAITYGAEVVDPKEFSAVECDILSPCAMGGAINAESLAHLRCKAIAGSANNQLTDPLIGETLMERGILYAPDYIINSGGIINAATEFDPGGYNPKVARDKIERIYDRLLMLFDKSERQKKATNLVADGIAEYNLKHLIGKRTEPLHLSTF